MVKHRVTIGPAVPLLSIYPREMKTHVQAKTCTHMFRAALLIIDKRQKQPQ